MNWQLRDGLDLFLEATDNRPAVVVYYMVSRKWCWNTYPNLDKRLPNIDKRIRFLSSDDARDSAERWIEAHFGAPLDAEPKAGDE